MFAEVTVIVDGAVDDEITVTDQAVLSAVIAGIGADAEADGITAEVYIQWHDHPMDYAGECVCAQYATDHHPDYVFSFQPGT